MPMFLTLPTLIRRYSLCHSAAPTLSSRPQWRDLIQLAQDSFTSLRLTGLGTSLQEILRLRSGDRLGCHSGRSRTFIRLHPLFHSATPTLPFGHTHSSIRPHSLFHSATLTLPFGHTHSIIRPYPLCHPDRSGGISSSWHKTLLLHSGLQVWVLVCRRSFGCAQDDRLGCHSGRSRPFIRLHPLFHSATLTLLFGRIHSVIRPHPLCHSAVPTLSSRP